MRNGASNTTLLASENCNLACSANSNENCGGSSTLTLFNNPSLYSTFTYPEGWTSYGCMTEATNARALGMYSFTSSSMTPQLCMNTCQAEGYIYSGYVECRSLSPYILLVLITEIARNTALNAIVQTLSVLVVSLQTNQAVAWLAVVGYYLYCYLETWLTLSTRGQASDLWRQQPTHNLQV